jgi:light-independent protochlorophyllide reductase subunit B
VAPEAADPRGSGAAPVPALPRWAADAEKELRKIPFFVRSKAKRNTELFAREKGLSTISLETLYDARAHFRQ